MTLDYIVSEKDYINFNKYHIKYNIKHPLYWKILHIFTIVVISSYVCFYSLRESNLKEEGLYFYIATVILIFIIGFVFSMITKIFTWINIKLSLRGGKNNYFIGNTTISLHDDFIEDITSSVTSHIKYSSVEKICLGYNCLYIYISSISAIIVPVSAFTDDDQKQNFLRLLKEKTSLDVINSLKGNRRSK